MHERIKVRVVTSDTVGRVRKTWACEGSEMYAYVPGSLPRRHPSTADPANGATTQSSHVSAASTHVPRTFAEQMPQVSMARIAAAPGAEMVYEYATCVDVIVARRDSARVPYSPRLSLPPVSLCTFSP